MFLTKKLPSIALNFGKLVKKKFNLFLILEEKL
jgi:hypothetical protein